MSTEHLVGRTEELTCLADPLGVPGQSVRGVIDKPSDDADATMPTDVHDEGDR